MLRNTQMEPRERCICWLQFYDRYASKLLTDFTSISNSISFPESPNSRAASAEGDVLDTCKSLFRRHQIKAATCWWSRFNDDIGGRLALKLLLLLLLCPSRVLTAAATSSLLPDAWFEAPKWLAEKIVTSSGRQRRVARLARQAKQQQQK